MDALVGYSDDYGEGPRRTAGTFLDIYEKFSKPSADVHDDHKYDTTRAMMLLQVLFFI